jgi:hypothetical protein
MVVVPAAIAPAQLVGKDPDSLMVVTRAFSGEVNLVRPVTTITSLCEPPNATFC